MPRLGIVYRLNDRMVLRIGSGLFYSPQQTNNFNILGLNPPFSGSTVFQNDRNSPTATIQNPVRRIARRGWSAAIVMLGWLQADRDNRSMYLNNKIWQWTTEIERSFGQNFVTGIAYVGSAGSHLDMPVQNWNNPDPGPGRRAGPPAVPVLRRFARSQHACFRSAPSGAWNPGPTPTTTRCSCARRSAIRTG